MLDFYINDSEYCLVDETYISLGKVYESKSEIVNFDQCILSEESHLHFIIWDFLRRSWSCYLMLG